MIHVSLRSRQSDKIQEFQIEAPTKNLELGNGRSTPVLSFDRDRINSGTQVDGAVTSSIGLAGVSRGLGLGVIKLPGRAGSRGCQSSIEGEATSRMDYSVLPAILPGSYSPPTCKTNICSSGKACRCLFTSGLRARSGYQPVGPRDSTCTDELLHNRSTRAFRKQSNRVTSVPERWETRCDDEASFTLRLIHPPCFASQRQTVMFDTQQPSSRLSPEPMIYRNSRPVPDALYAVIPPFRDQYRFPRSYLAARRPTVFQRSTQHGVLFPVEGRGRRRVGDERGVGLGWRDGDVEVGVLGGVEDV
jgi:hypothetical protein